MEVLVIIAVIYALLNLCIKGFMEEYVSLEGNEPEQTDGGFLYVEPSVPSIGETEILPAFTILPHPQPDKEKSASKKASQPAFYHSFPPSAPETTSQPDGRDFTDDYDSVWALLRKLEAQNQPEQPPVHHINLQKEPISITLNPAVAISLEPLPPGMDYGSPPRQNLVPNPYNEIPFEDFHVS